LVPLLASDVPLKSVFKMTNDVGYSAALAQAALGPVAAGSAFAVLQSAGMGGYGLIVVKAIAASGSVAGICSAAAVSFLNAMKEETCDDENKDKKE
jgi:hypothetical protein